MRATFAIMLITLSSFAIAGEAYKNCKALTKCNSSEKKSRNVVYGDCLAHINRGLRYSLCFGNCNDLTVGCRGICKQNFSNDGIGFCLVGKQKKDKLALFRHTMVSKF